MIYLCFYADGPRADNLVRLPALPNGVSYDRPFRYRDTWIEDELLSDLRADPAAINGQSLILAMRFLAADLQDVVVPLRAGIFQGAALSPDQNQLYFRVGRLVDFAQAGDLMDLAYTLSEREPTATRGKLLFRTNELDRPVTVTSDEAEDASWTKLTDLIVHSQRLPVHAEARRALYMKVHRPRRRKALSAKKLHHSWTTGDIYGFSLPERSTHELVVLHRLPSLIGTNEPLTERPDLVFAEDSKTVAVTPPESEVSANYDRHVVTLTGQQRSGSWAQFHIDPSPDQITAGQQEIVSYGIAIPLKIRLAPLYRIRTQIVPIVLVAGALFASSYYASYATTHKEGVPFWPSALASFFASLVIFLFKR